MISSEHLCYELTPSVTKSQIIEGVLNQAILFSEPSVIVDHTGLSKLHFIIDVLVESF